MHALVLAAALATAGMQAPVGDDPEYTILVDIGGI